MEPRWETLLLCFAGCCGVCPGGRRTCLPSRCRATVNSLNVQSLWIPWGKTLAGWWRCRRSQRSDANVVNFLYHEYLGFGSASQWKDGHLARCLRSSDGFFHPPFSQPVPGRAVRPQLPVSHLSETSRTRAPEPWTHPWLSPRPLVCTWTSSRILQHPSPPSHV